MWNIGQENPAKQIQYLSANGKDPGRRWECVLYNQWYNDMVMERSSCL